MSERTVHAVVLRRRDSGENDRRLTLLTREEGKIDVVARGARKAASRLAGSSDPLTVAAMSLAEGRRNLFVTQAQPIGSYRGLRRDYDRLTFALAFVELCAAVLPYGEPSEEAFDLLTEFLECAETHSRPIVALVWAEIRLLSLAGFEPEFSRCVVTGDPVAAAEVWISPAAGGFVSDRAAGDFSDRSRVRVEILYGLDGIAKLETPPKNLKLASECLAALLRFWRHVAEAPLPANESIVAALSADRTVDAGP